MGILFLDIIGRTDDSTAFNSPQHRANVNREQIVNMDTTERSRGNLVCTTCQQRFKFKSQLRQHESSHNGQFKCTNCPVTFKEYSDLSTHTKLKHQAQAPRSPATLAKTTRRSKPTSSKVTKHSQPLLSEVKHPKPKKSGRQHDCAQVDKYSYICKYCERGFHDKYRLRNHVRIHTGGEHSCPVSNCPYRSTTKYNIKIHCKSVHTTHHSNSCPHCAASFKFAQSLEKHIKLHSGVNEYLREYSGGKLMKKQNCICAFCQKSCLDSFTLENHIRTHTKEKPFRCPELKCPFRCGQASNIVQHISLAHTEKNKFACSQCSASFKSQTRLTIHEATHDDYELSKSESLVAEK